MKRKSTDQKTVDKGFIVIAGTYPYRFYGPFDETEADHWVETMRKDGWAGKVELESPSVDSCAAPMKPPHEYQDT